MKARTVVTLVAVSLVLLVAMACEHDETPSPGSGGSPAPDRTRTAGATATPEPTPISSATITPEPTPAPQPTLVPEPTAAAAPTGTPVQAVGSGIRGQALMGPMCPVVRSDEPCPDEPIQATIDVRNVDRTRKLTSFTTDADGRFSVALPPGEYLLDPQSANPNGGFPFGTPQTVTVAEDAYTTVTIHYDTGIR